ncbi:MAG TPA: hypothetical protein VIL20_11240 [Sandaracinaceae bacterium]
MEADALRALSRTREAADAYDDAAARLPRASSVAAAFSAARLRLRELSDPAGALASLDAGAVDAVGSPLRERALALGADALAALGRTAELREVARAYLRDYPLGSHAPRFARLAGTDSPD